jgi:hypothetical protein
MTRIVAISSRVAVVPEGALAENSNDEVRNSNQFPNDEFSNGGETQEWKPQMNADKRGLRRKRTDPADLSFNPRSSAFIRG